MSTDFMLTNGELLAKARKDAGLSQHELARLVGVSENTVYRWEHNVSDPSWKQLRKIVISTGALWLEGQLSSYIAGFDLRERHAAN